MNVIKKIWIGIGVLFFSGLLHAQVEVLPIKASVLKSNQLKKLPPSSFSIIRKYESETVRIGENAFLGRPKAKLPYIIGDGVQYVRAIPNKPKLYNFPLKGTPACTAY